MRGLLEQVLTGRYGDAEIVPSQPFTEYLWNPNDECFRAVLYKRSSWDRFLLERFQTMKDIYGDAVGGCLVGESVKVAMLHGPAVFGLYSIGELQAQKEVSDALTGC